MAKDLIFELGSEELPAGFIHGALLSLETVFKKKASEECRVGFKSVRTLATPRRLTLIVEGLEERQPDATIEIKGPNKKAAYDTDGKPTGALLGFARSQDAKIEELKLVSTDKGEYVYAVKKSKGRPTAKLLPEMLKSTLSSLTFPKAMRWGNHDVVYARPLHWIAAVYGGKAVRFAYGHIKSSDATRGHRFSGKKGAIKVKDAAGYIERLREHCVIVDPDERRTIISSAIEKEAVRANGAVLKDDGLLQEVVNLVEYPVVVTGSFEREFLRLPKEVVVNAMREHQRYFSVVDKAGNLLPYFITVANTPVKDLTLIIKGNERVLRARLNDARFYFERDLKTPLKRMTERLKGVVFQARLGTSYEKVERFTRLAIFMGSELGYCGGLNDEEAGNPAVFLDDGLRRSADTKHLLARAALLCKADLTSGMVGEFPKLQGVMGRVYAREEGEPEEVCEAIYEHYMPSSAAGDLPASDAGAIISMADKLDTITGCFGVGLIPTGAHDPYGLRRQAIGIMLIMLDRNYALSLDKLVDMELLYLKEKLTRDPKEVKSGVLEFFRERLRNQLLSQGLSFDSVDSVLSAPWFNVSDAIKRVAALEKFKAHPSCPHLVIAFKRVSNILRGQEERLAGAMPDEGLFVEEGEKSLSKVSRRIEPLIRDYWAKGDYEKVFSTLASIKDSIDAFFDEVMVMAEDERLRTNRLTLLLYVRGLYWQIADLSRLVV
ncbi:MAG: glycine--tRNA ligase subunit beta [Deltaproteobacteria bacterium]|nr:glycine--tRNA ligase subunit beta [Deltaproteobacteria bacterium]